MEHLLFRLYGPMAAWGDVAVGEARGTAAYPSKSATLGLVAAGLGIDRGNDAAHQLLHNGLGFAVQVLSTGELLRDYHTVQMPSTQRKRVYRTRRDELHAAKLNTILSTRDYRCDAMAVVCLWRKGDESTSLEGLQQALAEPHFVLYLGRKSCPLSLPLQAQIIDAQSLRDAFANASFSDTTELGIQTQSDYDYHWEEHPAPGFGQQLYRRSRKDRLLSRQRWQFTDRNEFTARRTP